MGKINEIRIAVRGGGDLATGVVQKLFRSGFKVVILETDYPLMIRRTVSLGVAVFEHQVQVEGMEAVLTKVENIEKVWSEQKIPVIVDPLAENLASINPHVVVDCIIAKRNLGMSKKLAPITIALGPGFRASKDVDVVIETMRGHSLGKLIFSGEAIPNTGVPGELAGKSHERVIHAPTSGKVKHKKDIGDQVEKGDCLFLIDDFEVFSPLSGTLRGLIAEGTVVTQGLKVADVDPRANVDCWSISDKARSLGGAVLEAVLYVGNQRGIF
ncbi:selenium-dependent molybdenum cofactor biosynthesis protein YqeB [Vagococcus elongatus]|uniref:Molybdenum hydroxylase n=1 Tax=Vagococcus elongatus TaxID=180344 RepID=A0A430AMI7_9ENTE|nr:selenium-dependent molybdenum cofactor biosynthesis protein YqeB [Vagococcus elongatus]RSU09342.1 molybdenum hydroxylase [Vagococcus elongatus]